MKLILLLTVSLTACASYVVGPDYSDAKKFCKEKGGFDQGNPIYFSCKDGTRWKRASHSKYDYEGKEGSVATPAVIRTIKACINEQVDMCGDLICEGDLEFEAVIRGTGQAVLWCLENPERINNKYFEGEK